MTKKYYLSSISNKFFLFLCNKPSPLGTRKYFISMCNHIFCLQIIYESWKCKKYISRYGLNANKSHIGVCENLYGPTKLKFGSILVLVFLSHLSWFGPVRNLKGNNWKLIILKKENPEFVNGSRFSLGTTGPI